MMQERTMLLIWKLRVSLVPLSAVSATSKSYVQLLQPAISLLCMVQRHRVTSVTLHHKVL
jgi:hypothetical protein